MNNQKDTQKTEVKKYGQSDVSDTKALSGMPIYDFANKKTEKLITALYLVSDCMETDDAIKGKLRLLGVELLSDIHKLSVVSSVDKQSQVALSLNRISELLSLVEIANTIGFISEMNTSILKKEFSTLASAIKESFVNDKKFTFTLDEKMFDLPEDESLMESEEGTYGEISNRFIKDKRAHLNSVSFINNKSSLQIVHHKKPAVNVTSLADRQDRANRIIELIKEKKNTALGHDGVAIKDISLAFTDCSEKTIQRELNTLVSKGHLKKTGSKRWSRYMVI